MYQTRNSSKQSSIGNKVNVLSLRSENVPLPKSTQIKKSPAGLSSINLRKRSSVKENDCKNNLNKLSVADKENFSVKIVSIHIPESNKSKNKAALKKVKPIGAKKSIITPENKKSQGSVKSHKSYLIDNRKTDSSIGPKVNTTKLKTISNHMSTSNVESSILKPCPVWKLNQNDNQKVSRKSKRSVVDIYDITEDEDLKKEELDDKVNLKKVKKQKLNKNDKSGLFKLKDKYIKKHPEKKEETNKFNPKKQPFKDENKLSHGIKTNLDEHLNGRCVQVSNLLSPAICEAKNQNLTSKSTLKTESPLDQNKVNTQICDQLSSSKAASSKINVVPIVDTGKLIFPKITPVKEIQLDPIPKENAVVSNVRKNINEQEMLFLIPQMTSTPEADIQPCTNVHIAPMNSFVSRMSEIPAIPKACSNIVEIDPAIEELLYSSDIIASADVVLFDSPPKVVCNKKNGEPHLKQLKMNLFLENCTGDGNEDLNANAASLFESPPKSKECKMVCEGSSVDKDLLKEEVKKPRKSYDNLDHVRVNISKWKKTEAAKKVSAAQKKEEELIKSLNEHFSELENFEFCFD